jgi:hypothetical protein
MGALTFCRKRERVTLPVSAAVFMPQSNELDHTRSQANIRSTPERLRNQQEKQPFRPITNLLLDQPTARRASDRRRGQESDDRGVVRK